MSDKKITFSNYLLIVSAYLKSKTFMVWKIITTEEVMDQLDMFQYRFGNIYKFFWWGLEIISVDAGTQFTSMEFQD